MTSQLFALALLAATPTPKAVSFTVDAGLAGGHGRAGAWTPVFVDVQNTGAPVDARVVVSFEEPGGAKGTDVQPVELPNGAHKRVTAYCRPRAGGVEVHVSIESAKGDVLADEQDVQLDDADDDTVLVGVVSMGVHGDPGLRPLTSKQTRMLLLDPEELPDEWPALRVLDALVLREPDVAALGPARIAAIKSWVSAGGTLVVTAGEKWRAMDDPTFTELLPVRVTGVRTVPARALPSPFTLESGDVAMAVTQPLRGTVIAKGADQPLAAEARYGLGRVAFLAVDPGVLGTVDAMEKAGVWKTLLALPRERRVDPNNPYGMYGGYNPYGYAAIATPEQLIQQELSKIPPLTPPSVLLVTALIGLYVLVVGPGDYLLLKKLGKLHWTWLTYPAAIVLFSGLIYAYARLTRSSEMMMRSISLVDVPAEPPGAPSPVRVFGGVYSPRAGRFEVAIHAPGAIAGSFAQANPQTFGTQASSQYTTVGGAHPSVTLAIPIWSMAGVDLDTTTDEPAPFLVDVGNDGKIHVTNTSGKAIDYVGLLYDGRVIDGGRLEPGRDVKISRNASGHAIAEVQNEVQSSGAVKKGAEDLARLARVFAFATDPPYEPDPTQNPYGLQPKRRPSALERPRGDQGQPMVFAVALGGDAPISVPSEHISADPVTIWRRPVPAAAWAVHTHRHIVAPDDDDTPQDDEGMTP